jgi:hypothetical protein
VKYAAGSSEYHSAVNLTMPYQRVLHHTQKGGFVHRIVEELTLGQCAFFRGATVNHHAASDPARRGGLCESTHSLARALMFGPKEA